MTFRVISVGWDCADWLLQTLASIEAQEIQDYSVYIVDDATEDPHQAERIAAWCDARDERWQYRINGERKYAVRNQVEGIRAMNPEPDDVIVWLDLDGDQLAHPAVFSILASHYSMGVDLTYGQYRPVPDMGTSSFARPYPKDVVEAGTYRKYTLSHGAHFNHLRTMRARTFAEIPESEYKSDRDKWLVAGADYVMMMNGLELAEGRYVCIPDVLMLYNHAQPHPDNVYHPHQADDANQLILSRGSVLNRITREPNMSSKPQLFLEAPERRKLLRDYGRQYKLRTFVETGTHLGETCWFLRDDFDRLFTIELFPEFYNNAVERFRGTKVSPVFGDSAEMLAQVLGGFEGPALFWLDGHHSGPGTAHGAVKGTPVVEELETLFADPRKHVILVDDARVFKGQPENGDYPHYADYPTCEWVEEQARAHGYDYELRDDVMRLTPAVPGLSEEDYERSNTGNFA